MKFYNKFDEYFIKKGEVNKYLNMAKTTEEKKIYLRKLRHLNKMKARVAFEFSQLSEELKDYLSKIECF